MSVIVLRMDVGAFGAKLTCPVAGCSLHPKSSTSSETTVRHRMSTIIFFSQGVSERTGILYDWAAAIVIM